MRYGRNAMTPGANGAIKNAAPALSQGDQAWPSPAPRIFVVPLIHRFITEDFIYIDRPESTAGMNNLRRNYLAAEA